jgi:hypothetical protein
MRRFIGRRRGVYGLAGATLLALGFLVSVGLAQSGPSYAKADILYHAGNDSTPYDTCGASNDKKSIGTATFLTDKGTLTVRGKIHGGDPGEYEADLYMVFGDGSCSFVRNLKSFKVNAGGDGEFAGSVNTCGSQFFVDAYNEDDDVHNTSLVVKLGGLDSCQVTTF